MNDVWVLLVTTPDGHDSPNDISLHLTAEDAIGQAERENTEYYNEGETIQAIVWYPLEDDRHRWGTGRGYEYEISRHSIPEAAR